MTLFELIPGIITMLFAALVIYSIRTKYHENKEIKKYGKHISEKIKYDNKDRRIYLYLTLITIMLIPILAVITGIMTRYGLEGLFIIIVIFDGLLALAFAIKYLDCRSYLSRLEKNGYIIPEDKREYGYSLEMLKDESDLRLGEDEPKTGRDRTSLILSGLSFMAYVVFTFMNLSFFVAHKNYGGTGTDVLIFKLVADCIWLILTFVFWRQSDNKKFKNREEVSIGKKTRNTLATGIITICILALITLVFKNGCNSMAQFIYKNNLNINTQYEDP